MAYEWAYWLPAVLRVAGVPVVEHDGWRSRGLAGGVFTPRAVVWHHDASPPGDSPGVPAYLIANFATASAQLWVDRAGVWHVIGAGRAPHAGAVLPGMPGNSTSLGVETDHTTGEGWPPAQLASLRAGTAAILGHLGQPPASLHFHKTICAPPGRKSDPAGLDLPTERAALATIGDQMPLTQGEMQQIADVVWNTQLSRLGVGPAPAQVWLCDARIAASNDTEGVVPPAAGAGGALSDADVERVAKRVADVLSARLGNG